MDGPIRMPKSRMEILARVIESYDSWFKIWSKVMVPKLMYQPKWFKSEKELKLGDLVYFPRKETALDSKWIMGVVERLERGRDGLIRMVDIRYGTSTGHKVKNRTIRKVVKLWGIEDIHLDEDLAKLTKRFQLAQEVVNGQDVGADAEGGQTDGAVSGDRVFASR